MNALMPDGRLEQAVAELERALESAPENLAAPEPREKFVPGQDIHAVVHAWAALGADQDGTARMVVSDKGTKSATLVPSAAAAASVLTSPFPAHVKVVAPVFAWLVRQVRMAYGCFLFCTSGALDAAGGFDEELFASEEIALSLALQRQGPFTILRDTVLTPGRKFRTCTVPEMLGRLLRLAWDGTGALRDRRLTDFWYAPRR